MVNMNKQDFVVHQIQVIYHLNLIVYFVDDMCNYLILIVDKFDLMYKDLVDMDNHDIRLY